MSPEALARETAASSGAPLPGAPTCSACQQPLATGARFCPGCGTVQSTRSNRTPLVAARNATSPEGTCRHCGAGLDAPEARFCRSCGQVVAAPPLFAAIRTGRGEARREPGHCRSCGSAFGPTAKFCPTCGVATRLGRGTPEDQALSDPAWYRVVRGLSLLLEGNVVLVVAGVAAVVVATGLSLLTPDLREVRLVRAGLMGAAALAAALGLVLGVTGERLLGSAPDEARLRPLAWATTAAGAATAVFAIGALAGLGASGFEPVGAPGFVLVLTALAIVAFLVRLVCFSTLLGRLGVALRQYRIAQGSVGFVVFLGVGVGVVGLVTLLFREARASVRTFSELLALCFGLLVMWWYLVLVRRGRDLMRQRLP